MDPLAAIGLVANIISFIDTGAKVVNNARVIYNAASNSRGDSNSGVAREQDGRLFSEVTSSQSCQFESG